MELPIVQVDAFTSVPFHGNPAAIVSLDSWLPDARMQSIAAENNLSETAFYVPEGDGYRIRWFTPAVEVDLCGHATLAAASVAMSPSQQRIEFQSLSGPLSVTRDGDRYVLDFPALPPAPCDPLPGLAAALRAAPAEVLCAKYPVCIFDDEAQIRALAPDFAALAMLPCQRVMVTAPGRTCDFVSRYFAPKAGINEDPVTGSAHSTLIPYWSQRLAKRDLFARQLSKRGGELWCQMRGDRVGIAGHAVRFLEGKIYI